MDQLEQVAAAARELGAPDVIVIAADVSKIDDCKRMVDQTVDHFGRCKCRLLLKFYNSIYICMSMIDTYQVSDGCCSGSLGEQCWNFFGVYVRRS